METIFAQGVYYFRGPGGNYALAEEYFNRCLRLQPNDVTIYGELCDLIPRRGRWLEAIATYRRATQLDPRYLRLIEPFANLLWAGRRYDEATAEYRRVMELTSGDEHSQTLYRVGLLQFMSSGSTRQMAEWLAQLPPEQEGSPANLKRRGDCAQSSSRAMTCSHWP